MRIGFGKSLGNGFFISFSKRLNLSGIAAIMVDILLLPFYVLYFIAIGAVSIIKLFARYVSWCVEENSAESGKPVWKRKWILVSCALVVGVTAICVAVILTDTEENATTGTASQEGIVAPSSTGPDESRVFNVIDGYDEVQSIFLTVSRETTYADIIDLLDSSGLYYVNRALDVSLRSIEIQKFKDEEYTNRLDITLKENNSGDFYVSHMQYIGDSSGIKLDYSIDSQESICIIDSTQKSANGALSKVDYFETKESALNELVNK